MHPPRHAGGAGVFPGAQNRLGVFVDPQHLEPGECLGGLDRDRARAGEGVEQAPAPSPKEVQKAEGHAGLERGRRRVDLGVAKGEGAVGELDPEEEGVLEEVHPDPELGVRKVDRRPVALDENRPVGALELGAFKIVLPPPVNPYRKAHPRTKPGQRKPGERPKRCLQGGRAQARVPQKPHHVVHRAQGE